MNRASNTRFRLTTQVGQIHVATRVLLNLGTNFQPYRPENAAEHQTSSPLTNTGQTGEHHQSDRSLLVKLGDFHRKAPHRSDRCNTPVRPVSARKPQNTKQAYRATNRPKLETTATRDNNKHTQTFTRGKSHK
jgi:negative regulator of sigma E activity